LEENRLPAYRAYKPTAHQRLIREMILLLKTGKLDRSYFQEKYDVDIVEHWSKQWKAHQENGYVEIDDQFIRLTMDGLLRVDGLLPVFFEPQHQGVRYT
ncbi:MAG: coproporphyrinogen III oxidase, partial [Planctomycetales bacterium]|nr:coproporphyrinogen III oxidase [Planctomycetales bacterium]